MLFLSALQGGVYVLQIMDWYLAAIAVVVIPMLEMIGLSWFYGIVNILSFQCIFLEYLEATVYP